MVTLSNNGELLMDLKYNWTIGIDTDLTIATITTKNFTNNLYSTKSLHNFFDQKIQINYENVKPEEGFKTRNAESEEKTQFIEGLKLFSIYNFSRSDDVRYDIAQMIRNLTKTNTYTDQPTFEENYHRANTMAHYIKLSSINSNITLEMVEKVYLPSPRYICKLLKVAMPDEMALFQIDQFYKIDSSISIYDCLVNELGRFYYSAGLVIANHPLEIEERNNLRGRTLKVARINTNNGEDSSIYTIFMNFLASSLNAR